VDSDGTWWDLRGTWWDFGSLVGLGGTWDLVGPGGTWWDLVGPGGTWWDLVGLGQNLNNFKI
jgi:hypothetical protein